MRKFAASLLAVLAAIMMISAAAFAADEAETGYVAMIGETGYTDFTAAIKAADGMNSAVTVKLCADINDDNYGEGSFPEYGPYGAEIWQNSYGVTLDLCGHTIEANRVELICTYNDLTIINSSDQRAAMKATGDKAVNVIVMSSHDAGGTKDFTVTIDGNIEIIGKERALYNQDYSGTVILDGGAILEGKTEKCIDVNHDITLICKNTELKSADGWPLFALNEDGSKVSFTSESKAAGSIEIGHSVKSAEITFADTTAENVGVKFDLNNSKLCPVAEVNEDGSVTYKYTTGSAKIGSTYYATLAEAVAAVQNGETITVTADHAGNGIIVKSGSEFTIDFVGHTYTVDGKLVGSSNSETNGFQLLKDSTLTFKNGAIAAGENATGIGKGGSLWEGSAKILVQNYSNLTLTNMALTGGAKTVYVLSNNFGNTLLNGSTSVTSVSGQYAFDVCYQNIDPYKDGLSVTLDTTGKITGIVEYSAYYGAAADVVAEKAVLQITNADMSGATLALSHDTTSSLENANITIGEGVELTAPDGYEWKSGKLELISAEPVLFEKTLMLTGIKADDGKEYRAFFTGIDSLEYKEVGFKFSIKAANPPTEAGDKNTVNKNVYGNTVYTTVTISQNGSQKTYSADNFGTGSNYIAGFVYDWSGITKYNDYNIESITYTPYAIKLDGTVVEGAAREVSKE